MQGCTTKSHSNSSHFENPRLMCVFLHPTIYYGSLFQEEFIEAIFFAMINWRYI